MGGELCNWVGVDSNDDALARGIEWLRTTDKFGRDLVLYLISFGIPVPECCDLHLEETGREIK